MFDGVAFPLSQLLLTLSGTSEMKYMAALFAESYAAA
jgi:hypothetical protein